MSRECEYCSVDISDRHGLAKYCSLACRESPREFNAVCPHCQNDFYRNRDRQVFCSRKCVQESQNTVDHNFFSEPNIVNSYYAGFIAADGCVTISRSGTHSLKIGLKSDDLEFLKVFAKKINGNPPRVYFYDRVDKGRNSETAQVSFHSKKIVEDLNQNFKICPRKTLVLEPPVHLSHENALAYLAGLIDGDGSYTYSRRRPVLSIAGTKSVLEWAARVFNEGSEVKKHKWSQIYYLTYHGDNAIRVREQYINMPLPFLDRKYRRWESLNLDMEIKK